MLQLPSNCCGHSASCQLPQEHCLCALASKGAKNGIQALHWSKLIPQAGDNEADCEGCIDAAVQAISLHQLAEVTRIALQGRSNELDRHSMMGQSQQHCTAHPKDLDWVGTLGRIHGIVATSQPPEG